MNKEGLFSTGGMYPQFKTVGKVWIKTQHVQSHCLMIKKHIDRYKHLNIPNPYEGCYLVEYEMVETNRERIL